MTVATDFSPLPGAYHTVEAGWVPPDPVDDRLDGLLDRLKATHFMETREALVAQREVLEGLIEAVRDVKRLAENLLVRRG